MARASLFEWGGLLVFGLILGWLLSCSAVKPVAPVEVVTEAEREEHGRLALARLLVDACTSEETTDERVLVADFVLKTCHGSAGQCLRRACLAIGDGAERCQRRSSHIGTLVIEPMPLASPMLPVPDSDL